MGRAAAVILVGLLFALAVKAADVGASLPQIPGITAEDRFPRACVDCHVNMPETGMDVRFSTLMGQWYTQVAPTLLARVRSIMPASARLSGRHPRLPPAIFQDIPARCMTCHAGTQANVPSFGPMMHAIHLTGGAENHYLGLFRGECANCHKFNSSNGRWLVPSGPEN